MNMRPMPMRDVKAAVRFCKPRDLPILLYQLQALWLEKVRADQRNWRHREPVQ